METIVAEVEGLKKSFDRNSVLKEINFKVKKGENLVVLGVSGSGKSVLIKCLVGLLSPDEGRIVLLGKNTSDLNVDELNTIRKKVGFLFQNGALYDSMTVRENIEFPLRHEKIKINREELVSEALRHVGLEYAIDKMPSQLSGGMKKRVALARTLILKPELILYDEPTTGLDPITSEEISRLIVDVQQRYNTAAVIITHDVECTRITANRILILKNGRIISEGTFNELSQSKDEWIRSFFN